MMHHSACETGVQLGIFMVKKTEQGEVDGKEMVEPSSLH